MTLAGCLSLVSETPITAMVLGSKSLVNSKVSSFSSMPTFGRWQKVYGP
jgi:hypothetical protein